jgi:nucleoside-diphosphate-sugar epimerase
MNTVPPAPTFNEPSTGSSEALPCRLKIIVTGATGFVGRHLVGALLERGHHIVAIARQPEKLADMPWRNEVQFIAADLHANDFSWAAIDRPDLLIHLAWPGLPNYHEAFHFLNNFPADYRLLRGAVEAAIPRLMVTGTGAEFGMMSGELDENTPTAPVTAYGIAKDTLRRSLFQLQRTHAFTLQWVRLFHMYGPGQNPNSLLAQLDRAIEAGDASFPMSGGEQLRDYLPIKEVAQRLTVLAEHAECNGVLHCCSGRPISVRTLIENRIEKLGTHPFLNRSAYPYPDYESMAYWGYPGKLGALLAYEQDRQTAASLKE